LNIATLIMPKVRRSRKPPPDGWELIEPTLEELEQKMREGRYETILVSLRILDCKGTISHCYVIFS